MSSAASASTGAAVSWWAAGALGERMAVLATMFVDSLDSAQRECTLYPSDGHARRDWHYVPRQRPGLPLRAMRPDQRQACWALLDTALSVDGVAKAKGVLALEAMLQAATTNKAFRDPENYALAIFGRPGHGPWAWRFEGHHISLTLALTPGIGIAVTPHFFGANPFSGRVVPVGHGGLARVLERESALAFEIVGELDARCLREAVIASISPADILTGPGREDSLRRPLGLSLDDMSATARQRTLVLLDTFFGNLRRELAEPLMARVREAGVGQIRFAWAGGTTPDQLHYYRLHGPTLIVEYDKTDHDHAHSVWHDPTNHCGEDHLRAHRLAAHGQP